MFIPPSLPAFRLLFSSLVLVSCSRSGVTLRRGGVCDAEAVRRDGTVKAEVEARRSLARPRWRRGGHFEAEAWQYKLF
jgi:hypothetical protein